jgi:hypothetical protein
MSERIIIQYNFSQNISNTRYSIDISAKFAASQNEIVLENDHLIALLKEDCIHSFNENKIKKFDYRTESWIAHI